jgi:hypothetical protein
VKSTTLGRLPLGDDWEVVMDGDGRTIAKNPDTGEQFAVYREAVGYEVEYKHTGDPLTPMKERETWYPEHWAGVAELARDVSPQRGVWL